MQNRTLHEDLVRERVALTGVREANRLSASSHMKTYFTEQDLRLLSRRNTTLWRLSRRLKLGMDVTGAAFLLVLLLPVLLAIAVAVKLDGGPVLFAHRRIGADRRRFPCFKFRSMSQDSEAILAQVLETNADAALEWAATQKLRADPRVTPVGAWLRKTSLDELPQLLNVLRLEMSFVGPRPIVDDEIRHYGDNIAYYYDTRPGLTGLWQVSGRSGTTYKQRVELDTRYVRTWTLWQDVKILARTVPAVLKRTGAI